MTTSNDSSDLKTLWQDSATPDVNELVQGVRRSRTRMWQLLAVELILTAAAILMLIIYALWGVFGERLWPAISLGAAAITTQAWTWRWRHGLWKAMSDAPLDLLRLQRKRTLVNLRLARYYAWGTPIGLPIGLAFAWLTVDENFSSGLSDPARLALLFAVMSLAVLSTVYGFRMARQCVRELALIDARISEIQDTVK